MTVRTCLAVDDSKVVRTIETSASEYITKPFDATVLVDRFRQVGLP